MIRYDMVSGTGFGFMGGFLLPGVVNYRVLRFPLERSHGYSQGCLVHMERCPVGFRISDILFYVSTDFSYFRICNGHIGIQNTPVVFLT